MKTLLRVYHLLILSVIALLSATTGNAVTLTPQQRALGVTVEDLNTNSTTFTALSTSMNRQDKRRFRFSGNASYGLRQDLAVDRGAIVTKHRAQISTSMTLLDRAVIIGFDDQLAGEVFTTSISGSGQFNTLDQEVVGQVHGSPIEASDLDISVSRNFELNKIWDATSTLDTTLGSSIPTSEAAQYEGARAVPYANIGWSLGFLGGRYGVTQSTSIDHIVNTFLFNPMTREINPDTSVGYSISTSARLGAGFRFSVGGTARLVHHLDETTTSALSNFQAISWMRGFTTVTLRHANGSRAEDHESSLWFVDEYKRIVSLSLSMRF